MRQKCYAVLIFGSSLLLWLFLPFIVNLKLCTSQYVLRPVSVGLCARGMTLLDCLSYCMLLQICCTPWSWLSCAGSLRCGLTTELIYSTAGTDVRIDLCRLPFWYPYVTYFLHCLLLSSTLWFNCKLDLDDDSYSINIKANFTYKCRLVLHK
jgi:hypothetical protein